MNNFEDLINRVSRLKSKDEAEGDIYGFFYSI